MSQWTHVNASIRFDSVFNLGLPTEDELGRICDFYDEDTSHWDNSILPCGSEGSIRYEIIRNEKDSDLAAMVIVFYGDLRDYDNKDYILEYFNRLTKGRMIRSGVLEIDIEYEGAYVFNYNSEKEEWNERS